MDNPTQAPVEPVVDNTATPAPEAPKVEGDGDKDLLARVNQAKDTIEIKPPAEGDFKGFNYNDIEKIENPEAREQALNAYKSFQHGFNNKFQELADMRKSLEQQTNELSNWTPERVQKELQNPSFVQAAQNVVSTQSPNLSGGAVKDEEWSALTESEKQSIVVAQKQAQEAQTQINQLMQQNQQILRQQQDEQLGTKYANYDAKVVDSLLNDMMTGTRIATREDIFRVVDYEQAMKRAYELGKQDRQPEIADKIQAASPDGYTVTQTGEPLAKQEGESNWDYFRRLGRHRQAEAQQGKTK